MRWHDEFQLICDPFFERLPRKMRTRVAANLSYDLVYLGKRKQGTWSFQLSLEGLGDNMKLLLHQSHRRRRDLSPKKKKTLHLPLYFDGNSGCIHVGERNKTIDELDLGLPAQPNDMGEIDTDVAVDSDQNSDVDSDVNCEREVASHITDEGTMAGSSKTGGDSMLASSVFAATDLWAFPDDDLPEPSMEIHVRTVENSPMFDGLPTLRSSGRKSLTPASRRLEPYGQAWARKKAQHGFL